MGRAKSLLYIPPRKTAPVGGNRGFWRAAGEWLRFLALCKAQRSRHTPWAVVLDIFAGEGTHSAAKTKSGPRSVPTPYKPQMGWPTSFKPQFLCRQVLIRLEFWKATQKQTGDDDSDSCRLAGESPRGFALFQPVSSFCYSRNNILYWAVVPPLGNPAMPPNLNSDGASPNLMRKRRWAG